MKNLELRIKYLLNSFLIALFFILVALFYKSPILAQTCQVGDRATGLVSAKDTITKFGNTVNGQAVCIKETDRAAFVSYKLPTYEDLKSIYFTQSKAPKTTNTGTSLAPVADNTVYNYTNLSTDITTSSYSYSGTAIVFIDGSIYINGNITATDSTKGLVLVVKNNVNIDKTVGQVDAVIISDGPIYTAGVGCTTSSVNVGSSALLVNGSLISLDSGKPIKFCRTLDVNTTPAEKVIFQPKYLVILRNIFADAWQKWSEIP